MENGKNEEGKCKVLDKLHAGGSGEEVRGGMKEFRLLTDSVLFSHLRGLIRSYFCLSFHFGF